MNNEITITINDDGKYVVNGIEYEDLIEAFKSASENEDEEVVE